MTDQLKLFDIENPGPAGRPQMPDGRDLRDKGIKKAVEHAEDVSDGWSVQAIAFLEEYIRDHRQFSGEQVREEARGRIPEPPSLRAWGGVLLAGSKRGWIKQVGYIHVENPRAHRANAALWESRLFRG